MPDDDFSQHPIIQALDETIEALTYLREGGTKMVPLDPTVWQDFVHEPQRAAAQAMPKVPAPSQVNQGSVKETPEQRHALMEQLAQTITACQGCRYAAAEGRCLGKGPTYHPTLAIVNGANLLGDNEMAQGSRLEGDAGALLAKMLGAIGLRMEEMYITHAMKCAVNKRPESDALQTCAKFLRTELQTLQPKAILLLGPVAAKALFVTGVAAQGIVGQWNLMTGGGVSIPTLTLHHPMRLLMLGEELSVPLKRENWAALQALQKRLRD